MSIELKSFEKNEDRA